MTKAIADLREASERGDTNHGAAQTVRASNVLDFMQDEKCKASLSSAMLVNAPVQHFLNMVFQAEKASNTFMNFVLVEPAPLAPSVEAGLRARHAEAEAEARRCNLQLLNRSASLTVQARGGTAPCAPGGRKYAESRNTHVAFGIRT